MHHAAKKQMSTRNLIGLLKVKGLALTQAEAVALRNSRHGADDVETFSDACF
jgi:hypothetical protein